MKSLPHVNVVTSRGILHNACLEIAEGKIARITTSDEPKDPAQLPLVIPSCIDLHIHGMGGYGPEQGTAQALLHLSDVLARQGVRAFCPTLYGAHPQKMAQQLRALVPAIGQEKGAKILGFHLEGPFLSPQKPGVMKPQDIVPARLEDWQEIYQAAQGHVAILTLAPEIPDVEPILKFCLQHHIVVQAGHTNATYEQMQRAFDQGVKRVTHLGNAMSGLHHRAPGVLGAVLENPALSCEVIADGKHVHPALLKILKAVKPISQITAVTDALLPTGQKQGAFVANGEEVTLEDGVWKRTTDHVWAGSALTMWDAFLQLLSAGYSLEEAVSCTGTNAAKLLSAESEIAEGQPADFIVLSPHLQLQHIFRQGQEITPSF